MKLTQDEIEFSGKQILIPSSKAWTEEAREAALAARRARGGGKKPRVYTGTGRMSGGLGYGGESSKLPAVVIDAMDTARHTVNAISKVPGVHTRHTLDALQASHRAGIASRKKGKGKEVVTAHDAADKAHIQAMLTAQNRGDMRMARLHQEAASNHLRIANFLRKDK